MDDMMEKMMEQMVESLIAPEPESDFETMYKNWGRLGNQEQRRKDVLKYQKQNRNNNVDHYRGILDLINGVEEDEDIFKSEKSKKQVHYKPTIYVAGFTEAPRTYKNVLMMSEWLIAKPLDFYDNWYVSPCPKGIRMLLVASRGKTKCYSKYGQFKFQTNTLLPGGNRCDPRAGNVSCCCVLDCIYQDFTNTMYVLDFLAWNNQPMTDCDTEFRKYWLESKFEDSPEFGEVGRMNEVKVKLLPKIPCTVDKFNEFMMTWPLFRNIPEAADGLLFYHKKAQYVSGETPLVGWLYPYMVNEVLGDEITVHEAYMEEKPKDYIDQPTFIKKFDEKKARKSRAFTRRVKKEKMETEVETFEENVFKEKSNENDLAEKLLKPLMKVGKENTEATEMEVWSDIPAKDSKSDIVDMNGE